MEDITLEDIKKPQEIVDPSLTAPIYNHPQWWNWVRREIDGCTHCAPVQGKSIGGGKAYMEMIVYVKNPMGGKDKFHLPMKKPLDQFYKLDYMDLVVQIYNVINKKKDESTSEVSVRDTTE